MGCICSKGKSANEYVVENHAKKDKETKANRSSKSKHTLSLSLSLSPSLSVKGDRVVIENDGSRNDAPERLIPNSNTFHCHSHSHSRDGTGTGIEGSSSTPISSDEGEKDKSAKAVVLQVGQPRVCRMYSVTRGERGTQVLAGWPSWLTAVAGEAISGWIPRRADSFEKLDKIGQGTYSSVYKARDLETNKIVALKKVRFANMDPESVRFMAREIIVLRRFDHPNVMKLEGMIASRVSGSLYLIFEYMEHDLVGLAAIPGINFSEAQIKCYIQQLLRGLEHCHCRGVMHRDIKGSNIFLNNNGNLKIGDFGLATVFQPSQGQPLTSRVVTLWYRPPELLLGATDYGVAVDLWSVGCVLAELFAGKPIMPGRTEVEQLHKIFKLCGSPSEEYWKKSKLPHATIFKPQQPYRRVVSETFKDFPSSTLSLLEVLLAIEPKDRGIASLALQNEFFTTKPLPSNPSTFPKYPPSKEFDAKLREEELRRRRTTNKGHEHGSFRRKVKESKVVPVLDASAELWASIEKRKGQSNSKSISEKYKRDEDGGFGFPLEPTRLRVLNVFSHSGQSMHPSAYGSSRNMNSKDEDVLISHDHLLRSRNPKLSKQKSCRHGTSAQLSRFSNSMAVRGDSQLDMSGHSSVNLEWSEDYFNMRYSQADNESNHLLDRRKSTRKKDVNPFGKDLAMGYAPKNSHIHYSGHPAGNLEDMLKEHERQIQQAIGKARLDKDKAKKADRENLTESLLHHV